MWRMRYRQYIESNTCAQPHIDSTTRFRITVSTTDDKMHEICYLQSKGVQCTHDKYNHDKENHGQSTSPFERRKRQP